MRNSFYNTNSESGSTLKSSENKAVKQEDVILDIYRSHKRLSASEAWHRYGKNQSIPLTSIRRAITNLCNSGKLQKLDSYTVGMFGKKEHVYQYFTPSSSVQLELFGN